MTHTNLSIVSLIMTIGSISEVVTITLIPF
jgi:hypothetical protein